MCCRLIRDYHELNSLVVPIAPGLPDIVSVTEFIPQTRDTGYTVSDIANALFSTHSWGVASNICLQFSPRRT